MSDVVDAMPADMPMTQMACYPAELQDLVSHLHYKPGWTFRLDHRDRGQGSRGLTLSIFIDPPDAYKPETRRPVVHYMLVPPAAYDHRSWQRWLLDQILLVERHEAMEFFQLGEDHPYAPSHGPGNDPYLIREMGTDLDRRTAASGKVKRK